MGEVGIDAQKNLNVSILNIEQQEKLRQFKIQTRINNETYLRAHPEVDEIIGDFLRHLLVKKPSDIREFAAAILLTLYRKKTVKRIERSDSILLVRFLRQRSDGF